MTIKEKLLTMTLPESSKLKFDVNAFLEKDDMCYCRLFGGLNHTSPSPSEMYLYDLGRVIEQAKADGLKILVRKIENDLLDDVFAVDLYVYKLL